MSIMFWVWIVVMVASVVLEIITSDLISIWFTLGAIVPFILSATDAVPAEWQIVIFIVTSAVLLASLRKIAKKYLLKNTNTKTNIDALIGQKFRMIERTDFETIGKVKVKDVEWSVIGGEKETIEKGAIVEVLKIAGNKLVVKEVVSDATSEND